MHILLEIVLCHWFTRNYTLIHNTTNALCFWGGGGTPHKYEGWQSWNYQHLDLILRWLFCLNFISAQNLKRIFVHAYSALNSILSYSFSLQTISPSEQFFQLASSSINVQFNVVLPEQMDSSVSSHLLEMLISSLFIYY